MSVATILQVVAVFREFGVPVTFEPGWETRGNGYTSAYEGGLVHHTAITASYANPAPGTRVLRDGRPDLSGPLCNFQGCFDGRIHVIAAHPANHAGASGGPSMGPLPRTTLFNPRVMGLEVDYAGNTPMSPEQYRSAAVFGKAIQRLYGTVERCRLHTETSIEGKWDAGWAPGQPINAAAFRADAANLTEDDMPSADEVADAVWNRPVDVVHGDGTTHKANAVDVLRYSELAHQITRDRVSALQVKVDALSGTLGDDEAKILAAIRAIPGGGGGAGLTPAQVETVVRSVFADAGQEG